MSVYKMSKESILKILIDTYDELPENITLKNVVN